MTPVEVILQGMNPGELSRLQHVIGYDFNEEITVKELRNWLTYEQDRRAAEELDKDAIRNFLANTVNLEDRIDKLYDAGFRVPEPTQEEAYIPENDPY